jgi:hypothetical protein
MRRTLRLLSGSRWRSTIRSRRLVWGGKDMALELQQRLAASRGCRRDPKA